MLAVAAATLVLDHRAEEQHQVAVEQVLVTVELVIIKTAPQAPMVLVAVAVVADRTAAAEL
jgi:hypothetical protein